MVAFGLKIVGVAHFAAGRDIIQDTKENKHCRARYRDQTKDGMQDKGQQNENRSPGRIKQRRRNRAGQEIAHRRQIADRRGRCLAALSGALGHLHLESLFLQGVRQPVAQPDQQAGAHDVQQPHRQEHAAQKHRQAHKRRNAAAAQGAIIDQHHVDRPTKHQNVDQGAEQADGNKTADTAGQGRAHGLDFRCLGHLLGPRWN